MPLKSRAPKSPWTFLLVEWRFDEPQPDWKVVVPPGPEVAPVRATRTEEALRLHFTEANRATLPRGRMLSGGIYVDLPDFNREDWASVELRARTLGEGNSLGVRFNLGEDPNRLVQNSRFRFFGDYAFFVNDGSAQTYRMRADWSYSALGEWEGPWRQLGLMMSVRAPSTVDVVSVRQVQVRSDSCTTDRSLAGAHRPRSAHRPASLDDRLAADGLGAGGTRRTGGDAGPIPRALAAR